MNFIKFLISKTFVKNIVIALVICLLLLVGTIKVLSVYTRQKQQIEVPDLSTLTLDEVKLVLDDIKLDYQVLDTTYYNPKYPKESVVTHQPKAGSIVKQNRKIYLTVNPSGYANVPVPQFYGKTKKEIERIFYNAGLKVGHYILIDDIGTVVRKLKYNDKVLTVGEYIPKQTEVDIVIGNGKLR